MGWAFRFVTSFLAIFTLVSCQSTSEFASKGVIENDELPLIEPYFATAQLLGHKIDDADFHSQKKVLEIKSPDRPAKLRVVLWSHTTPSRDLFILLPGFGGTPQNSTLVQALAHRLWLIGFDVLSVPSTTSVPGQAYFLDRESPGNIVETEGALLSSIEQIILKVRPEPSKVHLAGMSWGAMQTLRLASLISKNEIQANQKINWGVFLAIAPPVDLSYSFTRLDQMYWQGRSRFEEGGQPNPQLQRKLRASVDSRLNTAERLDLFNSDEVEYLLAYSFYQSLRKITPPLGRPRVSFEQYIKAPWGLRLSTAAKFEQWKANVHLFQILNSSSFPKNRSIVFHSVDDFINAPGSSAQLKETLGPQMILYRRGGHLGFLNSTRFHRDLARSLSPLLQAP